MPRIKNFGDSKMRKKQLKSFSLMKIDPFVSLFEPLMTGREVKGLEFIVDLDGTLVSYRKDCKMRPLARQFLRALSKLAPITLLSAATKSHVD